ncbi:MAG: glutaredoxin domain-containing protein [Polyangiaceae bacterium]
MLARSRAALMIVGVMLGLVGIGGVGACSRGRAAVTHGAVAMPVIVTPTTEGLLLTWIDDKGDFHVETRVADVPMMGRDAVRVVDPRQDQPAAEGLDDDVLVADLRQTSADGRYPIRTMTRAAFEALAVARREKAGPTMAAVAPSSTEAPTGASAAAGTAPSRSATRVVVVIYGAEWCSACHQAAQYLRSKGIAYIDKDIEKDPAAAREMQSKLAKNGLPAGSIPVIDVRGKIMVGFNPTEIDAALGEPL